MTPCWKRGGYGLFGRCVTNAREVDRTCDVTRPAITVRFGYQYEDPRCSEDHKSQGQGQEGQEPKRQGQEPQGQGQGHRLGSEAICKCFDRTEGKI